MAEMQGTELVHDLTQVAFIMAWPLVQQFITESRLAIFSWLRPESPQTWKLWVSGIAALLSTSGIHWDWAHSGSSDVGYDLGLHLTIPPLVVLGHALVSWVGQHQVYKLTIKGPELQEAQLAATRVLVNVMTEHLNVTKTNTPNAGLPTDLQALPAIKQIPPISN